MRLLLLAFFFVCACSSNDDSADAGVSGMNACTQSGGRCAVNIPFTCTGGNTVAATDDRATACGKSEGDIVRDIECCLPKPSPADSGMDTSGSDSSSSDSGSGSDSGMADASEAG